MAKYRQQLEEIETFTWEEFLAEGRKVENNEVDGVLWSFNLRGYPVTHKNDEKYIISHKSGYTVTMEPNCILCISSFDNIYVTVTQFEHIIPNMFLLINEDTNKNTIE